MFCPPVSRAEHHSQRWGRDTCEGGEGRGEGEEVRERVLICLLCLVPEALLGRKRAVTFDPHVEQQVAL